MTDAEFAARLGALDDDTAFALGRAVFGLWRRRVLTDEEVAEFAQQALAAATKGR